MASDKISNVLGTQIPQWVINQLDTRSNQNTQDLRDNDNILYLANKSAWVRLVSSVNINKKSDFEYFKTIIGDNTLKNPEELSKKFVLFGGISKYLNTNSYGLRSGLGQDGAYGILGNNEIQKYGYKPMPGITNVSIETQGKLGSVRAATINFKCWDKDQLDIIDALYFKLGFSMFLEWGHTFFYKAYSNKIESSELYSIDPFKSGLNKEEIFYQITQNSRDSEGNYEAMLGIVTNFNFSYNQDGGYDCLVKIMSLGVLGDSIKINNPGVLPGLLKEEIINLNNTLIQISNQTVDAPPDPLLSTIPDPTNDILANLVDGLALNIPGVIPAKFFTADQLKTIAFANNNLDSERADRRLREELAKTGNSIVVFPSSADFKIDSLDQYTSLNKKKFYQLDYAMERSQRYIIGASSLVLDKKQKYTDISLDIVGLKQKRNASYPVDQDFYQIIFNTETEIHNKEINIVPVQKYVYTIQYKNKYSKTYYFTIEIDPNLIIEDENTAKKANLELSATQRRDIIKKIISNGDILYSDTNLEFTPEMFGVVNEWPFFSYEFKLQTKYSYKSTFKLPNGESVTTNVSANIKIKFNDSSIISSAQPAKDTEILTPYATSIKLRDLNRQNVTNSTLLEDQNNTADPLNTQIDISLKYQSALEIILRTIEVHSLTKAIKNRGDSLDIGQSVYPYELWNPQDEIQGKTFLSQIFSNGIFSNFINDLVQDNIKDSTGNRLQLYAKYGFASSLMSNSAKIEDIKRVNYKELLKSYTVPYNISQEITKGINTNHPVYIPFGLLLMILNNICTIYDTKKDNSQTPLVYIDFNPELNFCLSNNNQLSTNPWKVLIPFQGNFMDYKTLFDKNILDGDNIQPTSGSKDSTPLFNPEKEDALSGQLPLFKETNPYRGKIMNILINIDYLIDSVKQFAAKDGTNKVFLKPFLEQVLSDLNKFMGNFNIFRLSYNDKSNTLQIVDDQLLPPDEKEFLIPTTNTTNIPLIGKTSIAKSIEIKSEISSKLSNMLAISANPDFKNKSTLSTNGDSVGYINESYSDRYITNRQEVETETKPNLDTIIVSANQFNSAIMEFYSTINPSETNVAHATNYYIDKMTKIKNDDYPTRASAMIPVSVNFNTDGIGGLNMMQGFTIPQELLPYTYTTREIEGVPRDHLNKVGFVIIGLSHTLENNSWNTSVKANMIFLKNKNEFIGKPQVLDTSPRTFRVSENNEINPNYESIKPTGVTKYADKIKLAVSEFRKLGLSDTAIAGALGSLMQESGLNPNAWNIGQTFLEGPKKGKTEIFAGSTKGQLIDSYTPLKLTYQGKNITAYGIAQWVGPRKNNYFSYQQSAGGDSLQTQIKYLIEKELKGPYKNSTLNPLKQIKDDQLSLAVNIWTSKFEGVPGVDITNRISYATGILEFIKSNNI